MGTRERRWYLTSLMFRQLLSSPLDVLATVPLAVAKSRVLKGDAAKIGSLTDEARIMWTCVSIGTCKETISDDPGSKEKIERTKEENSTLPVVTHSATRILDQSKECLLCSKAGGFSGAYQDQPSFSAPAIG